jgi:hypothetical protein
MKDWVAIVGGILGIAGVVGALLRKLFKKFDRIEKSVEYRKEESILIIKSIFGICAGLTQLGANGPVTEAKAALQEYIIKRGE